LVEGLGGYRTRWRYARRGNVERIAASRAERCIPSPIGAGPKDAVMTPLHAVLTIRESGDHRRRHPRACRTDRRASA